MRFSASIRNNVLRVAAGFLLNTFKIKKRRGTVFFEDLLGEYIKKCENSGYEKRMEEIGKKWMVLYFDALLPEKMKILPPLFFLNDVMRPIWMNLGLMKDFRVLQYEDRLIVKTINEGITRLIGQNRFNVGALYGIFSVLFRREVEPIRVIQRKDGSEYVFKLTNEKFAGFPSKGKENYDSLNSVSTVAGFTLKEALKNTMISLTEDNRIYFRNRPLWYVENTLFHLISNEAIMMDEVPEISCKYFSDFLEKDASAERKLSFLKNFLQMMGWGLISIVFSEGTISIEIRNPPYGLQIERDNWTFLLNIILGYLWTIDKNYKLNDVTESHKKLVVDYLR